MFKDNNSTIVTFSRKLFTEDKYDCIESFFLLSLLSFTYKIIFLRKDCILNGLMEWMKKMQQRKEKLLLISLAKRKISFIKYNLNLLPFCKIFDTMHIKCHI